MFYNLGPRTSVKRACVETVKRHPLLRYGAGIINFSGHLGLLACKLYVKIEFHSKLTRGLEGHLYPSAYTLRLLMLRPSKIKKMFLLYNFSCICFSFQENKWWQDGKVQPS